MSNSSYWQYYHEFKAKYPFLTGLTVWFNGCGDDFGEFYDWFFFHTVKMDNFSNFEKLSVVQENTIEINKKDRTTILNSYLNGKLKSLLFLIITNDERVNFNDYGCRGCLMIDFNTDRVKIELEQTLEENHSEDLGHMTFLIEENGIGDDADFV